MKEISFEESLTLKDPLYIDVRSPGEFEEDHIIGAVNLPIFDNEERKEVGTLYRMAGRETAVLKGTEIGGRRIGEIINRLSEIKGRDIVIYCARGGMRSGSVAALINSLGIDVYRIKEGYKAYRRYVCDRLSSIKIKPEIFILQGLTGAGKTEIIRIMDNSIDIEEMAGHRSSVFGGIGLKQKSQKFFETLFLSRIDELEHERYVIIEGESRKVGNLHIPDYIFAQMRGGHFIYIDTPLERRISIIRDEYNSFQEHERVVEKVNSLKGKLGSKKADMLVELYNSGRIDEFIEILLLDYYDLLYSHSLNKYEYITRIKNNETAQASEEIKKSINEYLAKIQ
ncbi:MAG TPA: tRNA 2-selenouridine(34) synthase MnmH [Spirochaetota bacterium]|nr:tRNA 2-selenouridine(34) synthase MnmH [Spirochaetota bacterium]HPF04906.1 tRNA 2-selenouridine(34) synthase MnmH [Spirochaetota bacterium]HPJ40979.1 tRNA 2-selenouridine(34) synthase MnmH [Spirochaetota bacterium]HPR37074.1 tRNA 2-selenouridine(34) synthase MnmH [Spirochaetota bacterium]